MIGLLRAEFRKLRTTQVWLWLLLADVGLGALVAVASLVDAGAVRSAADVPDIFATANGALLTAFLLGILAVTTEFRHQTITPTMLATPSRRAIIAVKAMTYSIVGMAYALACLAVQLAIAVPWLSSRRIGFDLGDADLVRALAGLVAVFALFAIIGLDLGALLRHQTLAVVTGLTFLLVVQNTLAVIPGIRPAWAYTPGGATTAILYPRHHRGPGDVQLLPPATGVIILLLWAFLPAPLAARMLDRDVT